MATGASTLFIVTMSKTGLSPSRLRRFDFHVRAAAVLLEVSFYYCFRSLLSLNFVPLLLRVWVKLGKVPRVPEVGAWLSISMFGGRSSLASDFTLSMFLGPFVQSIVSLTSLLVAKMLTVLVSTISKSQVILLTKMWVAFANATHIFFSKNISVYAILNDQSFNDMLTNVSVSFEQLGPDRHWSLKFVHRYYECE